MLAELPPSRILGALDCLTKWLSQCGQNSSASSNLVISFLKAFLHFLQRKAISTVFSNSWSDFSAWHSAHCRGGEG